MTEINIDDGAFSVAVPDYTPDHNPFGHGDFMDENPGAAYHFEDAIDFFDATPEGDFLSNFYPAPVTCPGPLLFALMSPRCSLGRNIEDTTFGTTEAMFAALKADRYDEFQRIAAARGPGEAKMLGRRCKMRADWDTARVEVMRAALALKFAPGTELAQRLLETETKVLIEGTMWGDRIWGVYRGSGRNLLGVLLMEQRGYLKAVRDGR